MAATEIDELREQLARLEAENTALRDVTAPTTPIPPAAAKRQREPGRWRAFVSALIIVIATLLVPIAIVSAWARVQLVDEDAFVSTLAPLAEDPAVQGMIIDETMDAITAQVDFSELTSNVFDGIADLGLPPRAAQALDLLKAPAADGLENLVNTTVTRVIESDAFADVWATTTRAAHRALTAAATSDGGGIVVMTDDGIGIQLGAIVERVKQNLEDRGVGVAQMIPAIDKVVIIGTGETLLAIRTTYAIASTLGYWLPIITLALFALGILIARRRSVAIIGTGVGFLIGGGALALGFAAGYPVMGQVAVQLDLSVAGLDVIYSQLIGSMHQTAAIIALLGVFIGVLGWFMGRSSAAARSRSFIRGVNSSARRWFAARGLNTGAFGIALARYRVLIRVVIAVLAVLWLFALRPLSTGDVFLVIIVAFVVAWLLELLQKRPDELVAPSTEDSALVAEEAALDAEEAAADAEIAAARAEAAAVWTASETDAATEADAEADAEVDQSDVEVSTSDAPAAASAGGPVEASAPPKPPRPKRTAS
ncbi:hypothetical protein [Microbacterium sp. P5_E9]